MFDNNPHDPLGQDVHLRQSSGPGLMEEFECSSSSGDEESGNVEQLKGRKKER